MKKLLTLLLIAALIPLQAFAGLAEDQSGKILLQVEENGEAWYVNPDNLQRYFLGRPTDAFNLMRQLGLGISTADLEMIPEVGKSGGNQALRERLSGKILLQVEENGEAWYVNPENLQRYFLGRPADAFEVMRSTGLGISNDNLNQITVSVDSAPLPTDELSQDTPEETVTNPEFINPEEETIEAVNAKYKLEFVGTWSGITHPNQYPANAHFSPFVAYAHDGSDRALIFQSGKTPSVGMEVMAESGGTAILEDEIENLEALQVAKRQTKGNVFDSPGTSESELTVTQDFSHVTFVSMIAPSPDWFVANTSNLFENGEWIEKLEVPFSTYDAGSDSGLEFTSSNDDTRPKEAIDKINNLQGLGKMIFTKID